MERREFLGSLGAPILAACAVCMGACSKGSSSSSATTPTVTADFTVDLNTTITTVGSSLIKDGVIVVRLATGNLPTSFTAVAVACTHEGTSIGYNATSNKFICPNHGSTFSTNGAVTLGPAAASLKQLNITVNGTSMRVNG